MGVQVITTVTPADDYDLVTLDDVKEELGITDDDSDDLLEKYITRASKAAANFCNQVFVVESIIDQFWPGRDRVPALLTSRLNPLQLSRYPLVAVASIVEDGTTLTSGTDYTIDKAKGEIIRLSTQAYPRRWPALSIVATYMAGFAEIPDDVQAAVISLVKMRWFARQRDPMLRQENAEGIYEAQYWFGAGPGVDGGLPPDIVDLLDNYRTPVFAA